MTVWDWVLYIYLYINHAVHCLTGSSMKTFIDQKKNDNSAWPGYFPAGLGVSRCFLFDVLNDFDFSVDTYLS